MCVISLQAAPIKIISSRSQAARTWVELAAATFSEQVIEADRWLQDHEHLNGAEVDQQP